MYKNKLKFHYNKINIKLKYKNFIKKFYLKIQKIASNFFN